MAFPKQTDIEIPLLQVLIASGGRATPKEAVERVTTYFPQLTPEDLTLKQPSGRNLKWRKWWNGFVTRYVIEGRWTAYLGSLGHYRTRTAGGCRSDPRRHCATTFCIGVTFITSISNTSWWSDTNIHVDPGRTLHSC